MDAIPPLSNTSLPKVPPARVLRPIPAIPDHEVVRQIGSGAYGEVWLAKSMTGAWRAIKVVCRQDFDDDHTFNREFEGVQNYEPIARNHPGLVHILHVGYSATPSPFYYYVMELGDDAQTGIHIEPDEYIPRTLQSDMKLAGHKPLPLDYCLEVGSQLAHALIYLHSKGLAHRDIKPSNVVFVNGRPKFADIGLVSRNDRRSFVGTEGFIPPEGPGTARADVYALAKVLYEISTGRDRLSFPELPDHIPDGAPRKKWLAFNSIICEAGEPDIKRAAITTAEELADAIDALKGKSLHLLPKSKKKKKAKKPLSTTVRMLLAAIAGAVTAIAVVVGATIYFLPNEHLQFIQPHPEANSHIDPIPPGTTDKPRVSPPSPSQEPLSLSTQWEASVQPSTGYVLVTSYPEGASVYDDKGNYLDETPYGPIAVPAGTIPAYSIRKEGFKELKDSGIVQKNETLVLGGTLKPYHPPVLGEYWYDASNNRFLPDGEAHTAELPLTVKSFNQFLKATKATPEQFPHLSVPESPSSNNPLLLLTNSETIIAYITWMRAECLKRGILSSDDIVTALPVPGYTDQKHHFEAYRLKIEPKTSLPIAITTSPDHAEVYWNSTYLGRTPLKRVSVNQGPFTVTIKKDGYAAVSRTALSPVGFTLSLELQKDQSVVYDLPWKNSLGMEFIPLASDAMVGACEVRIKDYRAFFSSKNPKQREPRSWKNHDEYPIANISRQEAERFAQWLTQKERQSGLITEKDVYRLPSDEEWSLFASIRTEGGITPFERSLSAVNESSAFYWGSFWPPKENSGNFADESALNYLPSFRIITSYKDLHSQLAPVKSYPPNRLGLYDLEGNVQEWISDTYGQESDTIPIKNYDTARGGCYLSFRPSQLSIRARFPFPPGAKSPTVGFRLILVRQYRQ